MQNESININTKITEVTENKMVMGYTFSVKLLQLP